MKNTINDIKARLNNLNNEIHDSYENAVKGSFTRTPIKLVDQILNYLPEDFWKNKDYKWVNPVAKNGVFLASITIRLVESYMKNSIFNTEDEALSHVLKNQIWGFTVYGDKKSKFRINKLLYGHNKYEESNIFDRDTLLIPIGEDMEFDILVGNQPYSAGLLDRKTATICNTGNKIIDDAAKTRIDAAFIVNSYEKLLKEGGTSAFVWPYVWTQLPSWSKFRKWFKNAGLQNLFAVDKPFGNEVNTNAAITIQKKGYTGPAYYNNEYRNSNIEINWDNETIPNAYGEIGYEIFEIEQKYITKTNFIWSNDFSKYSHYLVLPSGYGPSSGSVNDMTSSLHKGFTLPIAGPIKPEGFVYTKTAKLPFLVFDNEEHKERYRAFYNSKLYKFILHQRKMDFNNKVYNVGSVPDICKNMKGEFTLQKAYDELGLEERHIKFIDGLI